jgi:hypothetical protein
MRALHLSVLALIMGSAAPCLAEPGSASLPESQADAPVGGLGRPKVTLDRLLFPEEIAGSKAFIEHLRRVLRREAHRANWGAGPESRIEYRFTVKELAIESRGEVLHVRCTAFGKLPKGKSAKSHLDYGGDPRKRDEVVKRVLEIVARGVITRLAELERVRRGELDRSGVRPPNSSDVE